MSSLGYSKTYSQQTRNGNLWPREKAGQYTCPGAFGSQQSQSWCNFSSKSAVEQFCSSDATCIGYAFGQRNTYYQPTRIGFIGTGKLHLSSTFAKTFVQINATNLNIAEALGQFTCGAAAGVYLNPPLDKFCAFGTQSAAQSYCSSDVQCVGYICFTGYCQVTRLPISSGSAVVSLASPSDSLGNGSEADNPPAQQNTVDSLPQVTDTFPPIQKSSDSQSVAASNITQVVENATTFSQYPTYGEVFVNNSSEGSKPTINIIIIVVVSFILITVAAAVVFCMKRRETKDSKHNQFETKPSIEKALPPVSTFSKTFSPYGRVFSSSLFSFSTEYKSGKNTIATRNSTLARSVVDYSVEINDSQSHLTWSVTEVCAWLISIGAPYALVNNAKGLELNGAKLKWMVDNNSYGILFSGNMKQIDAKVKEAISIKFGG